MNKKVKEQLDDLTRRRKLVLQWKPYVQLFEKAFEEIAEPEDDHYSFSFYAAKLEINFHRCKSLAVLRPFKAVLIKNGFAKTAQEKYGQHIEVTYKNIDGVRIVLYYLVPTRPDASCRLVETGRSIQTYESVGYEIVCDEESEL